jgi:hypothetical protein
MRITELSPEWIGDKKGIMFLCPCCKDMTLTCYFEATPMKQQMQTAAIMRPNNHGKIVPVNPKFAWTRQGDDFETLTITPSVDASASGHWHGFITNGLAS